MFLYLFLAFKADESPDARFQTAKPKFSEIMKENLNTGSNNKSGATSAASNIAKGLKLSVDDGHLKVEIKTSSKDKDLIKGKLDTLKGKFDELLKSNKLAKEAGKVNLNEEGEFSIITYETDVEGVGNTSEESGGSASAESSVDTNIGGDDAMDTGASSMAKAFAK